MKKQKEITADKRSRVQLIVAIVAVVAVLGAITLVIVFGSSHTYGKISAPKDAARGSTLLLTYTNNKLKRGDKVDWFVGDKCIGTSTYGSEGAVLNFTPSQVGDATIKVVSGKYTQKTTLKVAKPVLTLAAKNVTVTYGDELPALEFDYSGLVGDDSWEKLGLQPKVVSNWDGNANVYEISFENQNLADCPYTVKYQSAKLTVLPKEITVCNRIAKVYDQSDVLESPQIELLGVVEGDDVAARADRAVFESKNAGEQAVVLENLVLSGADSGNYRLNSQVDGVILKKALRLTGLTVADKFYDGTTSAKISKMGNLEGVLEGDSVAIGSLDVSFAEADVGQQPVLVRNVTLVGYDKDNYFLNAISVENAQILSADD